MQFELRFNNQLSVLPSVSAFVGTTLRQTELAEADVKQLEDLVLRVVNYAIEHAYLEGEEGEISLAITHDSGKLEMTVRDYGLPQDIEVLEEQLHEAHGKLSEILAVQTPGVVDEKHWIGFGSQGKALQFVKWLHDSAVDEDSHAAELSKVSDDAPLAPEQEYDVRRMQANEALQVAQLIYRTYGGTYFNEDVYYPDRIAALNSKNRVLSMVAAGEDGQLAGHCALELNQAGPVAEVGQAAVDPRHRGRGLLNRMKAALQEEARSLGLVGWYADSVTVHTYTQQSNAHHGGHVCGLALAVSPKNESFRGIAQELKQRVSCVVYFHGLIEPELRTVYVPERHQEMVAAIYGNLGYPVEFKQGSEVTEKHGTFAVKLNPRAQMAMIRVGEFGEDSLPTIRRSVRDLVERSHVEVVVVEMPVDSPMTASIWQGLEGEGLGFTGIGPHFASNGDVVTLTYLVEPVEREPIKTFEPFADTLVNYALAEQQRVRATL
ncbi:MAG: GNAT family N-acetyltransferase [Planctomycetaceae bacterium]|nr:GNAT family N-acetyltransferase [Planctomycetaceae bacterium]